MAQTKLSAEKIAARYAKVAKQLSGIDAKVEKAQRTLATAETEKTDLTLRLQLLANQYAGKGGDVEDLAASIENDESDEDSDEDDDFSDED